MCRVVQICAEGCRRPHRAFRERNQLTALPESFGQLTALQWLYLSRASACAEWRCRLRTVDGRIWQAVSMCVARRARRGL